MDIIMEYLAHWIIGIAAFVIWGWGKSWGIEPSLISYAAIILPSVVAAAGVQAIGNRRASQNAPVVGEAPVVIEPPIAPPTP